MENLSSKGDLDITTGNPGLSTTSTLLFTYWPCIRVCSLKYFTISFKAVSRSIE